MLQLWKGEELVKVTSATCMIKIRSQCNLWEKKYSNDYRVSPLFYPMNFHEKY